MATLSEYLDKQKETATRFAERLKISRVSVSRIINGKQMPSPDLMARIYRETNGAVTANDFVHPQTERAA